MTLVEFLTQRLDEDEAYAKLAQTGHRVRYTVSMDSPVGRDLTPGELMRYLDHTKRFGPPRSLREVEAKRRMLDEVRDAKDTLVAVQEDSDWDAAACWSERYSALRPVLGLLALPYADHPDYREEWKP